MSHFSLMSHQVAVEIGLSLEFCKQQLEYLVSITPNCHRKTLFYHHCEEAPLGVLDDITFPFECPACGELIESKDEIKTDSIYFFDKFFYEDKNHVYQLIRQLRQAKILAIHAHRWQRYGGYQYDYHLKEVVQILIEVHADIEIVIAGWLHDTLEDTKLTFEDIKEQFGDEVADLVWCVTDEKGNNRRERKLKTYPKIRANQKAIILKLADRIANVKFSQQNNPRFFQMYVDEQAEFSNELRPYSTGFKLGKLWDILDQCFKKPTTN